MNDFLEALKYLDSLFYSPNHLILTAVQEERLNHEYGAGRFQLLSKSIRFRVAKITPTKTGQFVAIWEKDDMNKNRPFSSEETPGFLVITVFKKNNKEFGQFVFPKEILIKKKILRSEFSEGKMAIRVYPSWDNPTSKQAMTTQKWQLLYFVDMSGLDKEAIDRLLALYSF